MSILQNTYPPWTALKNAQKMTRTAAVNAVKAAGLLEYGRSDLRPVAAAWDLAVGAQEKPDKVIGALDNSDTEHMFLAVLRQNPAAVVEGLAIAAYATGAGAIEVVIPAGDAALKQLVVDAARGCGVAVSVTTGIVDVRAARKSIVHHLATAAAIAALFAGPEQFQKSTVVAVKKADQTVGEPLEIPYGRTVGDIAGINKTATLKAVGIGTKLYDPSALDLVIEETFPLENGVITLYDSSCCMADQAAKAMLAIRKQSCGKCTFCREGAIQIHTMLKDITGGKGKTSDPAMIREIAEAMPYSCLCSLGQNGGAFPLAVLQYFGEEVESHIRKQKCPAAVCQAFTNIYIDPVTCEGCGDCLDVCPAACIEGKPGFIHLIDEFDCTKCGKCVDVCANGSIKRTQGRRPKLPERLTRVGRFK